ncbi:MAG: hypothetical protein ACAI38_19095 [Myxococcota bacterium]|nr:hypothetical protein [Myxococcota bacterium]
MTVAALGLLLAISAPAPSAPTVVVFPLISEDAGARPTAKAVYNVLSRAAPFVTERRVLAGRALRARLHMNPRVILNGCRDDVNCLGRFGKRQRAAEVIVGHARSMEGGAVRVLFVVFDVGRGEISRKLVTEFASVREAKSVIGGNLYDILGITDPAFLEVSGIASDVPVLVDDVAAGNGPGSYEVRPGLRRVSIGELRRKVMLAPGATARLELAGAPGADAIAQAQTPLPPDDLPMEAENLADDEHDNQDEASESITAAATPLDWRPVVGISLIGTGVAAAVLGTYFGLHARSTRNQVDADTTQLQVYDAQQEIRRDERIATVGLALGAAAAAAGVAVLIWPRGDVEASAYVAGNGGAMMMLGGRF